MKELINRQRWLALRTFLQDVTEKLSVKGTLAVNATEYQDDHALKELPVDRSNHHADPEMNADDNHNGGSDHKCAPLGGAHFSELLDCETIPSIMKREQQILELIWAGFKSKEIGHRLGISVRTVEVHRANMMKKMHVSTTAQLLKEAAKAGHIR